MDIDEDDGCYYSDTSVVSHKSSDSDEPDIPDVPNVASGDEKANGSTTSILDAFGPIDEDNDLMRFVTDQGVKMRILFETLQSVLVDGVIVFNKSGMSIEQINTNCCFIQVKLDADKIQSYYCKETYSVGMNFQRIFACMRSVGKDDIVVLRLTKKSYESSTPAIVMEQISPDNTRYSFRIHLMDIDEQEYNMDPQEMEICVTLQSALFSRIVNCCSQQGKCMQIMSGKNYVKFGAYGDHFTSCCVKIPVEGITALDHQLVFPMQFMSSIKKASTMGNSVNVHISKDYPLLLVCQVGTLGIIRFFLPPKAIDDDDDFPQTIDEMEF